MKNKTHDFHLVQPSPWPIFISIAILIFALGLVSTFRKQTLGVISLLIGICSISIVLMYWWLDIIKEAMYDHCHTPIVKSGLRYAMYLFLISEVVFFLTLFCSFFKAWLNPVFLFESFILTQPFKWSTQIGIPPNPWSLPLMNTLILLLSGTTVTWAKHSLLENDHHNMMKMLYITLLLGICFIIVQAIEYYEISLILQNTDIYTSNFYVITGFHVLHVIIGMFFLSVCLCRARQNHFTLQDHLCIEFASWYWHFVDYVWIFVFIFIYCLSIY
ncbi:cytochrome c oxidase subunit 3 [Wolbachia endosymbiont of Howardula sp.]|uniref:cytochrome c oxidase subunit 3 n=1 Tax=Wolbachia endosymbiont of Howardula sp. TaxID=2916816 RepID=UPI00217D955A|nr:cytochrome c oxidase subunit 3 [Wolbachia endosymbiont of Howardula sp.]UWI83178.1 cytochrome c oxidase subunit 3 [Wolbachia endosymbiont of Howardula sp.]